MFQYIKVLEIIAFPALFGYKLHLTLVSEMQCIITVQLHVMCKGSPLSWDLMAMRSSIRSYCYKKYCQISGDMYTR